MKQGQKRLKVTQSFEVVNTFLAITYAFNHEIPSKRELICM